MREFVAVDAGGTSSRAVVVDEAGRMLGSGRGAGGNPTSVGLDAAADSIVAAIAAAARGPRAVAGVLLAHAGGGGAPFHEAIGRRLEAVGVRSPITAVGDLAALFASGTARTEGVAMIGGTGAIAGAVRDGEVARLVDGTGWLLGDSGSGFWIGHRVARLAVDDLDGGPSTRLTAAVLDGLGIADDRLVDAARPRALGRLIARLYEQRPVELSRLAPLAFRFAADDPAAAAVVRDAVAALAALLARARAFQSSGPVVLGGSVLVQGVLALDPAWSAPVRDAAGTTPLAVADGLVGAAVLALRAGGVRVDGAFHARLAQQLR